MKKIFFTICITAIFAASFTSCQKDELDIRDQFIGAYSYESELNMTFNVDGETISNSGSGTGLFSIEKHSDDSKISIKYPDGTTDEYSVSGKSISMSKPYVETLNEDGVNFVMTGTETNNGSINGKVLTINANIVGTLTTSGSGGKTGTFTGTGIIIATKK